MTSGIVSKHSSGSTLSTRTTNKFNRDGLVRGWFDDKLVIEQTDVVFRTPDFPAMKWNQFLLTPYFGPGLLPHAQALWIDELVIATKRIGPYRKKHLPRTP